MLSRSTIPLETQISFAREAMVRAHFLEEAQWLAVAAARPRLGASHKAVAGLIRAAEVALDFGYPAVAAWITGRVLNGRDQLADVR